MVPVILFRSADEKESILSKPFVSFIVLACAIGAAKAGFGDEPGTPGICIRGETRDLVFEGNTIRDTRPSSEQTQTVGILIEKRVGRVVLKNNQVDAEKRLEDRRPTGQE